MFYIGLDLGKRQDPTAIAVVERIELAQAWQATAFHSLRVRHLERVPLGTPYPGVVARIREIVQKVQELGPCALAVDGTGVGEPVVDMLRAARIGCDITAVTITGGETQRNLAGKGGSGNGGGAAWSVPKRDLLALVQVLLERNELRLAKGLRELGPLLRELTDVRSTRKANGRERLGADGCGEHDDLVIALALACWRARRPKIGHGRVPVPGVSW
jgi:hypothetical protein